MCDAGACSVCLDPLLGQDDGDEDRAIGAFTPCGHVLHVACYEEMKKTAASRGGGGGRSRSSPPSASRSAVVVKCPNCNTPSKHFMRLYGLSKGTAKSAAEAEAAAAPGRPPVPAPAPQRRGSSPSTSARNAAAAAPPSSSSTTRRSAAEVSPPGPRPPSTPPSHNRRAAGRRRGDGANPTPVQQTQQQQQQQQQQSRPTAAAASHRVGRINRARRPASSIATPSTTRRTAFGAFRADRTPAASVTPSRPFCPSPPPPPPPPPILPPAVVPPPYCAPPPTVFVPHSPFAFGSRATDGAAAAPQRCFIASPVWPSNPAPAAAAGNLTNASPYYAATYSANDGLSAFHHGTAPAAAPVNFPDAIPNANHPSHSWNNGGGLGAAGGFAAATPVVFSLGVHPARPKRKRRPRNRQGGVGVVDRTRRPAPQRHLQSPGTTPLPFSVRCCGNQQCGCRGSAGL